jgi:hypothetical protein
VYLYSQISDMNGPTYIFWASLTPFSVQWAKLQLHPPTVPPLTEAEKASARGGCQLLNQAMGRIFRSV